MKQLLLAIFLLSQLISLAQEVELTVQTGHTASVNDVSFSPFDEFVATAGNDNKVVIWDFESGKQYKVLLGHEDVVHQLSFHPDNDILISSSADSTIKFWEYQTGKLQHSLKLNFHPYKAEFNSAGDRIYVAGEKAAIISYPDLKIESIALTPKKSFTTVEVTSDEKYMLLGGKEEHFGYLIDLTDFSLLKKFTHPILNGTFDEEKGVVYFCTNNGLAFSYDIATSKKKGLSTDLMLNTINDIVVDQNFIYTADDYGMIRQLEKDKWFQNQAFRGKLGKINSLSQSNDGRYLIAAGNNKSAVVWDLEESRVVKVMKGIVSRVNDISFSENGQNILVVYEDGSMRNTNLITNITVANRLSIESDVLSKVGHFSITRIVEFNDEYAVLDALYKQSSIDMEGIYDRLQQFKVRWNFETNLVEMELMKDLDPQYGSYIKDMKKGVYHDNLYFQDTTLRVTESEKLKINAQVSGSDIIINNAGKESRISSGHSDIITSIAINEKYGFLASASWDGMIRFWDIEKSKLLTVFGAFGDGQFVYIDLDGYYFSSKNALSFIGFSIGNQMFSFEQFDLKYNRPDLVIKDLPYFDDFYQEAFEKAYYKRLSKLGLSEEELEISKNIPTLEITNNLSDALVGNKLNVSLKCRDEETNLALLHVFVNGVPEFGRFGKEITGTVYNEDLQITLNPGTNYIQCFVTNEKRSSSLKRTFMVEAPKTNEKSDLYLLSIGVSSYEQKNYNLQYASKDARDVAEFFEASKSFENIHSQMLLDAAATKENIISMGEYFSNASENDVVVLFVAGHGVLDDELDYYFAPHNMDFNTPETMGVPFEIFDELLDQTKCRKKVMFLDACHSGEIDKDEVIKSYVADEDEEGELKFRRVGNTIRNIGEINSFELSRALFADMRINNGSTVISSSGGAEYAIEGERWHNGVFTYALLKGLRDKKADYNKDRKVTLSELQSYVQTEVHNLTDGKQTPTSRVENLNYDFVISE